MKAHLWQYLVILSVWTVQIAFSQQPVTTREKEFFSREIERYKAYFNRSPKSVTADDNIDVTYYRLTLKITTSPNYLKGDVLMNAKSVIDGLSTITLDLMNAMTVDSILMGGSKVQFTQYPSTVEINLDRQYNQGELVTVDVYYEGIPGSSGFGSFEFSTHSSVPWVWSLSEPYGAKDWWPCKDHPHDKADSTDQIITVDSSFRVGSNGRLVSSVYNGDGTITYHWQERYPISTYLISVAITNYAQFTNWFHYSPTDSMPVLNYVLPEHLSSATSQLPLTVGMLTIYSNLFGLYPFVNEKYGHSEFGWGGGMEHQTMTSVGGFDEGLVAHELAHQWYGDMITCDSWPDIWLNEGFATYCECLYREQKYGKPAFWSDINGDIYGAKSASGSVYVLDSGSVGTLFDWNRVYAKGAWVLHMLRHVIGDSAFFHSMYAYAHDSRFRFGTATTSGFQSVCESVSGEDLHYFFDEWVYGQRYPHYSYGWTFLPGSGGYQITIGMSQTTGTPTPAYFTMPVDFKIIGNAWDTTVTAFNNAQSQSFSFSLSHQPMSVVIDPQGWILNDHDSLKSFVETPNALNFDSLYIYSSSTDTVRISNGGATNLVISNVAVDDSSYSVSPDSGTISPGGSQLFFITFHPTKVGVHAGLITFYHNAPTSPDHIAVTGVGVSRSYPLSTAWNLVSLPVNVLDPHVSAIFPGASPNAYMYPDTNGYVVTDTMMPGWGYWVRYPTADVVTINGNPRLLDTVNLETGWNLIGSLSSPVVIDSVISIPPGNIASRFFGYYSTYVTISTLDPIFGYWVKAFANGKIVLRASSSIAKRAPSNDAFKEFSRLTIASADGKSQTLYFCFPKYDPDGSIAASSEMPPLPPAGSFDVRFGTGGSAVSGTGGYPIIMTGVKYPMRLSWSVSAGSSDAVLRMNKKELHLMGDGHVLLDSPRSLALVLSSSSEIPVRYNLSQNWPNPFNPATNIQYEIPVPSIVSLTITNVLGQEVVTLLDAVQEPGFRSIAWNGTDRSGNIVPTGIYFYRITATSLSNPKDSFSQVRKMLFMK